jgi:hypothetical protein
VCAVTFDCPHCGTAHRVTAGLVLDPAPDHAGRAAQLWLGGDLPPAVAALLGDLVWCDGQAEYVSMRDPEWVTVTPAAKMETNNAGGQPDWPGDLDAGEGVEASTSEYAHNQKLTFHVIGAKRRDFFRLALFFLSEAPSASPGEKRGPTGHFHPEPDVSASTVQIAPGAAGATDAPRRCRSSYHLLGGS